MISVSVDFKGYLTQFQLICYFTVFNWLLMMLKFHCFSFSVSSCLYTCTQSISTSKLQRRKLKPNPFDTQLKWVKTFPRFSNQITSPSYPTLPRGYSGINRPQNTKYFHERSLNSETGKGQARHCRKWTLWASNLQLCICMCVDGPSPDVCKA